MRNGPIKILEDIFSHCLPPGRVWQSDFFLSSYHLSQVADRKTLSFLPHRNNVGHSP